MKERHDAPAGLPPLAAPRHRVLHPGDVACGTTGDRLETLLGSCVSVVLTDPRRTVGVMCHVVHGGGATGPKTSSWAYAGNALAQMLALIRSHGLAPAWCEAWVVGGGNMFPAFVDSGHVGEDNVRCVRQVLREHRIHVLWEDVGGDAYRRLSWTVGVGEPNVVSVSVKGHDGDQSLRR